jgi:protein tyrosine phosphatase (PTP) superfamily phosphohydrolase (DUF442 family)
MKRTILLLVAAVAVSMGVDALADLTQDRPDRVLPGTRSEIILQVQSHDRGGSALLSAQGLWGACQGTVRHRLAEPGVTEVADGRFRLVTELGMKLVRIPMRDGQVPSAGEVESFLDAARESGGTVFVHCGAGVGRTGAMVGAYLVNQGELSSSAALRRNLAVGPPSLEQIAFVAKMGNGLPEKPGAVVTAVSRVLDAPRRMWSRLG